MANRDAPNGFRPIRHLAGGSANRFNRYHIASALASTICRGDMVIPTATTKNIDAMGADTDRLLGCFDGCYYIATDGSVQYTPRFVSGTTFKTGTSSDCWVYDDPYTLFEGQYTGTLAAADIGSFADVVRTASDATTNSSRQEVKANAGSGANLKIIDLIERPDNDFGSKAKVEVAIALHYHAGAKTAI